MDSGTSCDPARYPPAMSRTVPIQETQDDTFAGLLERLAHRAQHGDAPLSRQHPAVLLNTKKTERTTKSSEGMELSYEKALRLHGRRRIEEDVDLNVDELRSKPIPAPASPVQSNAVRASHSHPAPARKIADPDPASTLKRQKEASANRDLSRVSAKASSGKTATPNSRQTQSSPKPPKSRSGKPARNRATRARSAMESSLPTDALASSLPKPQSSSSAQNSVKTSIPRKAGDKKRPQKLHSQDSSSHRKRAPHSAMANETISSKLVTKKMPSAECSQASVLHTQIERISEQRKSIISVRLNEEEFSRLRSRASESGVSVSAYMRSCVLDAEHLRYQVKQALAEMRAYSHPLDSNQITSSSALARSTGSGFAHLGTWSRVIAKSATFFFGLWFFPRRGA